MVAFLCVSDCVEVETSTETVGSHSVIPSTPDMDKLKKQKVLDISKKFAADIEQALIDSPGPGNEK